MFKEYLQNVIRYKVDITTCFSNNIHILNPFPVFLPLNWKCLQTCILVIREYVSKYTWFHLHWPTSLGGNVCFWVGDSCVHDEVHAASAMRGLIGCLCNFRITNMESIVVLCPIWFAAPWNTSATFVRWFSWCSSSPLVFLSRRKSSVKGIIT